MEKFQKISSRSVILLAILWAVLVTQGRISIAQAYMMIGALAAYIGVQNIILLNWGQRSGKLPRKMTYLIERHGQERGLFQYVLVNVLLYLLIGLAVAFCGWMML